MCLCTKCSEERLYLQLFVPGVLVVIGYMCWSFGDIGLFDGSMLK